MIFKNELLWAECGKWHQKSCKNRHFYGLNMGKCIKKWLFDSMRTQLLVDFKGKGYTKHTPNRNTPHPTPHHPSTPSPTSPQKHPKNPTQSPTNTLIIHPKNNAKSTHPNPHRTPLPITQQNPTISHHSTQRATNNKYKAQQSNTTKSTKKHGKITPKRTTKQRTEKLTVLIKIMHTKKNNF